MRASLTHTLSSISCVYLCRGKDRVTEEGLANAGPFLGNKVNAADCRALDGLLGQCDCRRNEGATSTT